MPNSRCSSRSSGCSQPAAMRPSSIAEPSPPPPPPPPLQDDPNDGRGDEIQPCPAGYLISRHPMAHTPPPPPPPVDEEQYQNLPPSQPTYQPIIKPVKERKLPMRSGSAASLFASQFASLTRRLGAKHKSAKSTTVCNNCFLCLILLSLSSRETGREKRKEFPSIFPPRSRREFRHFWCYGSVRKGYPSERASGTSHEESVNFKHTRGINMQKKKKCKDMKRESLETSWSSRL